MIAGNYNHLFYRFCIHLKENKELCHVLISSHGNRDLLTKIISYFRQDIINKWNQVSKIELSKVESLYIFVSGGSTAVLEEWINSDFEKSPESVANEIEEIVFMLNKQFINNDL